MEQAEDGTGAILGCLASVFYNCSN